MAWQRRKEEDIGISVDLLKCQWLVSMKWKGNVLQTTITQIERSAVSLIYNKKHLRTKKQNKIEEKPMRFDEKKKEEEHIIGEDEADENGTKTVLDIEWLRMVPYGRL